MLNIVKIQRLLVKLPSWLLTIIVILVILYLTLWPDPLPDDTPHLFPGADKVVHALMFGGLTLVILIDRQRYTAGSGKPGHSDNDTADSIHDADHSVDSVSWPPLKPGFVWPVALASSLFGAVIECLQWGMGLGRGFEAGDIVADTVGSFLFAALWLRLQHNWTK